MYIQIYKYIYEYMYMNICICIYNIVYIEISRYRDIDAHRQLDSRHIPLPLYTCVGCKVACWAQAMGGANALCIEMI